MNNKNNFNLITERWERFLKEQDGSDKPSQWPDPGSKQEIIAALNKIWGDLPDDEDADQYFEYIFRKSRLDVFPDKMKDRADAVAVLTEFTHKFITLGFDAIKGELAHPLTIFENDRQMLDAAGFSAESINKIIAAWEKQNEKDKVEREKSEKQLPIEDKEKQSTDAPVSKEDAEDAKKEEAEEAEEEAEFSEVGKVINKVRTGTWRANGKAFPEASAEVIDMIHRLQKLVKVKADGVFGNETAKAIRASYYGDEV